MPTDAERRFAEIVEVLSLLHGYLAKRKKFAELWILHVDKIERARLETKTTKTGATLLGIFGGAALAMSPLTLGASAVVGGLAGSVGYGLFAIKSQKEDKAVKESTKEINQLARSFFEDEEMVEKKLKKSVSALLEIRGLMTTDPYAFEVIGAIAKDAKKIWEYREEFCDHTFKVTIEFVRAVALSLLSGTEYLVNFVQNTLLESSFNSRSVFAECENWLNDKLKTSDQSHLDIVTKYRDKLRSYSEVTHQIERQINSLKLSQLNQ